MHITSQKFLVTSMVIGGGGSKRGHFKILCLLKSGRFGHDWTLFVGSSVQRALIGCDRPADARLCPIWIFSETTAPMVLKFHMQHDEASGLQNDKIQPGRE